MFPLNSLIKSYEFIEESTAPLACFWFAFGFYKFIEKTERDGMSYFKVG